MEEGHCRQSAWRSLRVVCDFSHWLARKRLDLQDVNEETVKQYERFRLRCRCPFVSDHSALQRLLAVLREKDIIAPRPPIVLGTLDQIAEDFYQHLSLKRGLARVTITRHIPIVRQFLHERCAAGAAQIARLTATDMVRFVERHAGDHGPRSAQSMCWTLRAFTRYLQYQGYVAIDLASSVPSVKRWRLTSLPTYLLPEQVQQILDRCERDSPMAAYAQRRDAHLSPAARSQYFFVAEQGGKLLLQYVHKVFWQLSRKIGLRGPLDHSGPRLHDFRHRFAVQTLLNCYHPGDQLLTFLNAL